MIRPEVLCFRALFLEVTMQTIDERFKDAAPKETVARIQKILQQHGIEVIPSETETGIANCYSLQLLVKGAKMLTNGKGINKELAYASAYACPLGKERLAHFSDLLQMF